MILRGVSDPSLVTINPIIRHTRSSGLGEDQMSKGLADS